MAFGKKSAESQSPHVVLLGIDIPFSAVLPTHFRKLEANSLRPILRAFKTNTEYNLPKPVLFRQKGLFQKKFLVFDGNHRIAWAKKRNRPIPVQIADVGQNVQIDPDTTLTITRWHIQDAQICRNQAIRNGFTTFDKLIGKRK